jgi:MYXO-CTERM domain-containing protein
VDDDDLLRGLDEPPAPYHFGVCVHDPDASTGYDEKPVMAMLRNASQAPTICPEPPDAGASNDAGDAGDAEGMGATGCGCGSGSPAESSFTVVAALVVLAARRRKRS